MRVGPKLSIKHVFRCARCAATGTAPGTDPLLIGYTAVGIQVWCRLHDMNVIHIDMENARHPACTDYDPTPQIILPGK